MGKTIKITTSRQKGNWVKRGIGHRVAGRTTRQLRPNIQQITVDGVTYIASVRDLKAIKKYLSQGMSPDQIEAKMLG